MAKTKKNKHSVVSCPEKSTSDNNGGTTSQIWNDERFAHLVNDPRFRGIPKAEKKVKIDKRFQSMFKDERFNVKHTIDKYGRKVKASASDELRKYYELESSGSEKEDEPKQRKSKIEQASDSSGVEDEQDDESDAPELDEEEKALAMTDKVKARLENLEIDYARGQGAIVTDSSSDDDSENEVTGDDEVCIEHVWGELDADAERTDESTRRLALCNMDWDRIKAVDIMVMLSSFLPRGAAILSVTVYPSEFGKERMREEEERGPQELTGQISSESDSESNEGDDKEKQVERLREYQLNRLKYFYAVVECDTVQTADKLYKECDGVEYESTANKIDLRFIPDEMEFDDEPKDKCTQLPEVGKYEPRVFTTTALNQAKVELTWDENDVERKEFNEKIRSGKLADLSDADLKKYVACSSSEDEGNGGENQTESQSESETEKEKSKESRKSKKQDMIEKYKALLGDIKQQEEKEKDERIDMEFTWKVNKEQETGNSSESETERKKRENVNPFEKILEKAKEKKRRRKELKKKKKRGELNDDVGSNNDSSEDDLPYGVDLNDPFFASAFDEKEFDLKKPKKEKKKNKDDEEVDPEEAARKRAELELMLDDDEGDKSHFNLKRIQEDEIDLQTVSKSKRKRILKKSKKQIEEQRQRNGTADDFELDLEDERFKAVYEKAEFNIDPTNPSFKKTKAMEKLIEEKLKKRPLKENDLPHEDDAGNAKKVKKDINTSLLVKSIKRKIVK